MSKYIKLEDAIEAYRKSLEQNKSFVSILQKLPSIEVVRCSQCKHFRDEDVGVGIYTWCELLECETDWDWFCKSGERCSNE